MKKSIIIAFSALALASCTSTKQLSASDLDSISWTAFCHEFGYDTKADYNNEQAINDYLDCWRGSVAEEQALKQYDK
jgi:predicted metal-dependent HD superfamily phosphohydrolase